MQFPLRRNRNSLYRAEGVPLVCGHYNIGKVPDSLFVLLAGRSAATRTTAENGFDVADVVDVGADGSGMAAGFARKIDEQKHDKTPFIKFYHEKRGAARCKAIKNAPPECSLTGRRWNPYQKIHLWTVYHIRRGMARRKDEKEDAGRPDGH